jgi:hypothetical protein
MRIMGGIVDKIKKKVIGTKDKVADTTNKATSTTKDKLASSTKTKSSQSSREYERGSDTVTSRTKDPLQEYDEKEPMSPAKIKQHEPTAVRRDPSDQKIIEPGRKPNSTSEEAKEKARKSSMNK